MEETKILKALYLTHKKHASLYLDLFAAFPDNHHDEIRGAADRLEQNMSIQILPSDDTHCLARITEHGTARLKEESGAFGMWKYKTRSLYIGVAVVALFIVLSVAGSIVPLGVFMGDITGTGLTPSTKEILMQWVEGQEQEKSDWYTFSLYEKNSDTRKTYLVQCKDEFTHQCKYNILFVEVDEKSKTITNVGAGQK